MPTVNTREYQFAFSLNKQADIGSVLNVGAINKLRPIRTFAPIVEEHPAVVSDQAWFGKGHSHPTFRDRIQRQYVMNAQERSATALEALYAAAFVMGNVVTIQPDSGGSPNEYQHTITWQDQAVNKEVLYTSVAEAMGTEFKKLLVGAWVDEFTMTGNRDDHVTISWTGGGRQYKDTTFTFPTISSSAFYKTLYGLVSFGLADSPLDISAEVLSWTITVSQNPQLMWLMGNTAGAEDLLTEVLSGDQTVTGNFVVKVNALHRDRFLDQDTVELHLILKSPTVIDNNQHQLTIKLHNLKIASEDWGEEGQTVAYTLNFDQESVLKAEPDEHLTFLFDFIDIDNSELLVTSPV